MTGPAEHGGADPRRWARRGRLALAVFGPLLVLTGIAGLALPARLSLMSGAMPYDAFHIACGILGCALALVGSPRAIAAFEIGFGALDLWQAVAGVAGWPPAETFSLRPADHVVHLLFGIGLVFVGSKTWAARSAGTA